MKKINLKNKILVLRKGLILGVIVLTILLLSVGYSAFNTELGITGIVAEVRPEANIRITKVLEETLSNNALTTYTDYNKDRLLLGLELPQSDASIKYKVEITNIGNVDMGVFSIDNLPNYLEIESIDGYTLKDKLCGEQYECTNTEKTHTMYITIKYNDEVSIPRDAYTSIHELNLYFNFQPFYTVTYTGMGENNYPNEVIAGSTLMVNFESDDIPGGVTTKLNGFVEDNYTYSSDSGQLALNTELVTDVENIKTGHIEIIPDDYIESENISVPYLTNDLTPIIYDEEQKTWKIAKYYRPWYSYNNQEWANAVILKSGVSKSAGDAITVDGENPDALAMFVWVPRYEYYINGTYGMHIDGTEGTQVLPGAININFISKNQEVPTTNYRIHPAFWFDGDNDFINESDEQISGIWVGKFSNTQQGFHVTNIENATDKHNAVSCYSEDCDASMVRILPNHTSHRYQAALAWLFIGRALGSSYGIDTTKLNTHMMKNVEWGAVAYLTQSIYGKYGNPMYSGANKEIYLKYSKNRSEASDGTVTYTANPKEYVTGISSGRVVTETTKGLDEFEICLYDDITDRGNGTGSCGGGASTTGNIYGIYDMSGGPLRTVASYFDSTFDQSNSNGFIAVSNYSGTAEYNIPVKYLNIYKTKTSGQECNGGVCYGQGFSETYKWYKDFSYFSNDNYRWSVRGTYTSNVAAAGIFSYHSTSGGGNMSTTSSIVMVPEVNSETE